MKSSYFILVILTTFFLNLKTVSAEVGETNRPNVLFLFTDDQCYDTVHAHGNKIIKTPHIDTLAENGTSFMNTYIMGGSCPAVCSPSRAALFSGLTLWNLENQGRFGYEISPKYKTLPQVFRESGYTTFATGKNEPGKHGHFARSFSAGDKIFFKGMSSHYNLRLHPYCPDGQYTNDKAYTLKNQHSAEVYADACIKFLEEQKDSSKPFFAYVAFQTPHDPKQAPEKFRKMYTGNEIPLPKSFVPEHPFDNGMLRIRDEKLEKFPREPQKIKDHIAAYYAMVTHTDAQIGKILKALEESGKKDNTIIIFTSDNGLAIGKHGLMGKQNVYEHSVRVPMIISGPGITKNNKHQQLCYLYDIYPTLCDLAGLKTPNTVEYKSLMPIIKNKTATHRQHLYFAFMSWQRSVRDQNHKLIEYCVEGKRYTQLFDLSKDPHETKNLAGASEYSGKLETLRKILISERLRLNDGNTPYQLTNQQGKDFWETYESVKETTIP